MRRAATAKSSPASVASRVLRAGEQEDLFQEMPNAPSPSPARQTRLGMTAALCSIVIAFVFVAGIAQGNPYHREKEVPQVPPDFFTAVLPTGVLLSDEGLARDAREMLRVRLDWDEATDTFTLGEAVIEPSGTVQALARAAHEDRLGSYKAVLADPATGHALSHDSIGTGKEFRLLSRALTFRFAVPSAPVDLVLTGEDPDSGVMQTMLTVRIDPRVLARFSANDLKPRGVEIRELRAASASPALILNVYAEGYLEGSSEKFFADAARIARSLENYGFPMQEHLAIRAVFAPSRVELGAARDLGLPVPERDSFLGLYFPYWHNFGRWYHVVYPTRVERFRRALAAAPYDYAVALIDDGRYWGVGNYRELTAIPARNSSFEYLLMHEFGHYYGLNEEYEGGGPTELQFAAGIDEPWSQNITFLRNPAELKWRQFVARATPLPTPQSHWRSGGPYGAYQGGYADSEPRGLSHKPGYGCTMSSGSSFCPICEAALQERLRFDMGL